MQAADSVQIIPALVTKHPVFTYQMCKIQGWSLKAPNKAKTVNLTKSVFPVSPTYWIPQFLQVIKYTQFLDLGVPLHSDRKTLPLE